MLNKNQMRKMEWKTNFIGEKEISKGKYIYSHFIRRKTSTKSYSELQKG